MSHLYNDSYQITSSVPAWSQQSYILVYCAGKASLGQIETCQKLWSEQTTFSYSDVFQFALRGQGVNTHF